MWTEEVRIISSCSVISLGVAIVAVEGYLMLR